MGEEIRRHVSFFKSWQPQHYKAIETFSPPPPSLVYIIVNGKDLLFSPLAPPQSNVTRMSASFGTRESICIIDKATLK